MEPSPGNGAQPNRAWDPDSPGTGRSSRSSEDGGMPQKEGQCNSAISSSCRVDGTWLWQDLTMPRDP